MGFSRLNGLLTGSTALEACGERIGSFNRTAELCASTPCEALQEQGRWGYAQVHGVFTENRAQTRPVRRSDAGREAMPVAGHEWPGSVPNARRRLNRAQDARGSQEGW